MFMFWLRMLHWGSQDIHWCLLGFKWKKKLRENRKYRACIIIQWTRVDKVWLKMNQMSQNFILSKYLQKNKSWYEHSFK
jgi:hypothetical protein